MKVECGIALLAGADDFNLDSCLALFRGSRISCLGVMKDLGSE